MRYNIFCRSGTDGVVVVNSFDAAIDTLIARGSDIDKVFVIGGSSVYEVNNTPRHKFLTFSHMYNEFLFTSSGSHEV